MYKSLILFFFFLASVLNCVGQGTMRGKITDSNGETLIGVSVVLKNNKGIGTITDFDGNYSLTISETIPTTILISYVGFQSYEEVVHLNDGQVLIKNIILKSSSLQMKEFEITAKSIKSRDYYVEKLKKNSATTLDYISSESMKKTGDANIVNAVSRVSGVSTNNDFITVRGIGDRYIKTSVNGSIIPTLDPFTNNIKLDLIPSSLVDNVIVTKTASPDLPGDWSGAYISVETKDYPDVLTVNVESTFGYNSKSTFKEVISSKRSKTDWFGFDSGFRNHNHNDFNAALINPSQYQEFVALGLKPYFNSLGVDQNNWSEGTSVGESYFKLGLVQLGLLAPALINDPVAFSDAKSEYNSGNYKSQAFAQLNSSVPETGKSFPNNWNTTTRKAPLNFSQSFSIGNQVDFFKKTLGYIIGFKYGRTTQYDSNSTENRLKFDGGLSSALQQRISKENNGWSGLVNLAFKLNPNNGVSVLFMPNLNGINKVRNSVDKREASTYVWTNSQYYEQRKQLIYQLKSDHYLPGLKLKMTFNASYTDGKSSAPDFKNLQYYEDPISKTYQIGGSIGDGIHRYYRYLNDNLFDSRFTTEFPLKSKPGADRKLKIGTSYQYNNKKSDQYDYSLNFGPYSTLQLQSQNIDEFLNLNNFNIHSYTDIYGQTFNTIDTYYTSNLTPANHTFGNSKIYAAFVMTDYTINQRIRLSGGVRAEKAEIYTDVTEFDSLGYASGDLRRNYNSSLPAANPGVLDELSFLPSLNIIYKIKPSDEAPINLRLNYYRSLARPGIRELSDVANFDYDLRKFVFGNSDLKMVNINNYDIRTELYLNETDNFSVSAFYKDFKNHIELVQSVGFTWENVDKSNVKGIELEAKMALFKGFELLTNVTLISSNTKFVRTRMEINNSIKEFYPLDTVSRPMFGQAPYVVNTILSYKNDSTGIMCTLSYNVQGPRLVVASDVKEIPDVYELPRHLLDFKITKSVGKYLFINIAVKDFLNTSARRSYKTTGWSVDYDKFTYGTTYNLGISFKL